MIDKLLAVLIVVLVLVTACPATAQTTDTAAAATTTTAAPPTTLVSEIDSRDTRERLRQVLHRLPPEVGKVLKMDPSLWTNQTYLNTYPALAAFVAAHPEVAHNSRYYLEDIWIPSDPVPQTTSMRVWRDMMEGLAIMVVSGTIIFVFTWLIRTIIQHRRWSRLSRVQAEVHNKLLDRFASHEEVMAYINTAAGKKFLEAAPIPLESGPRAISAPISRVLWSVQAGLILGALGIGLKLVSLNVEKDVAPAMSGLGVLAIALGVGFIVSAIVSLILSKRLGLWSAPATETAE
jgi:small-conductance mechanosensitive channel